ncbi:MAG: M48 family metallopeptidase [Fibrobacteria bacterium]|nr:M48 family metallopeptidase [Fibrobacteria bacterium]
MDLTYRIVRSKARKRLTISVERDRSVLVHAPFAATDETIRKAVESKRRWLWEKVNHPLKYAELPHPPGKEIVNGESIPYLGRHYRLQIQDTASGGVEFSHGFTIPARLVAEKLPALVAWYRARAREILLPRVRQHALKFGVEYANAKIVDSRYRWGSCTARNNVTFNWRLIKAPMFVIDYVIAHELAHLLEPNHTPRFWGLLRAHSSKLESAKAWLLENGQELDDGWSLG